MITDHDSNHPIESAVHFVVHIHGHVCDQSYSSIRTELGNLCDL